MDSLFVFCGANDYNNDEGYKLEIFGMTEDCLREAVSKLGLSAFRRRQIVRWLYKADVWDFAAMTDIAAKDAALLREKFTVLPARANILGRKLSKDGLAAKLLVGLPDGQAIEAVGLRHDYGYSVCVSSQAGCAMGCAFCASAAHGLIRNLTAAEMLAQAALLKKHFIGGANISNVVVMGSGEPLLNYEQLIMFLRLLHDPAVYNIGFRNMTVSTCGIIPGINRLAAEKIPVTLAVSLHAPEDGLRGELMPVNRKYKIAGVVEAAARYAEITGRRVTYEYLLIKDVNDGARTAEKLAKLLQSTLCAVNIIPVNPIKGKSWQKPGKKRTEKFVAALLANGVTATVRKEMGSDIQAACGQLRARYISSQARL
ncbi:MAG: 23S rRNA (adenine(2503)-C(2))-methyltransferase RlmN [Acidaminococcales bacterium]|jgi:23S rRNA (adenine2503-C2)-methyltransferase|nr:23S rRNA (adenine(2503)-C(2))-methyltransferase RlmN [Acidaminococcales bacterium]